VAATFSAFCLTNAMALDLPKITFSGGNDPSIEGATQLRFVRPRGI
jgi:hypothetical protein